jgi:molybdopterin-guanine dinucleotide biosynthesis protein A
VADALRAVSDDLLVIANDPAAPEWLTGVRVAPDARPGNGSLGGLHAALAHAGTAVVVVAWDMPFVTAELLGALRALGEGADAAVPESTSRRGLEPLCAYYASACLPAIERCLDQGDRRVISFFEAVEVARLPPDRVATFGDPEILFLNVNSPADLALAEAHATARDHRRPQA